MWIALSLVGLLVFIYWYTYPRLGEVVLSGWEQQAMQRANLVRRRYDINGISVSVLETEGRRDRNKPLLMMIHGFTGDNTVWLALAAQFKDDYHVVVPDLPGHGQTGFSPDWQYSISAQAKLLNALIWRMGYQRATLIGNSMGGYIAAYMARYQSNAIEACILLAPAGLPANQKSQLDDMLDRGQNPFFVTRRRAWYRLVDMSMASGPYVPKMVKDVLADRHIKRVNQYQRVFTDFIAAGYFDPDELVKIQVPVLTIWGGRDELLDPSALDNWVNTLHCDWEMFHDVGHMPMLEAPGRTYQRIVNFIQVKNLARQDQAA
ncbi:alpha/beta fold hydrolase [Salinimonas lutimaris]|uniref:alpha/beta fold hydrolase n=1 Tax=Salinimonas lutimaris TaxID=914153 RepID=UPI0010C05F7F|nr:alpha/beta hydrolase [Salinimonas lutimaris]